MLRTLAHLWTILLVWRHEAFVGNLYVITTPGGALPPTASLSVDLKVNVSGDFHSEILSFGCRIAWFREEKGEFWEG